MARTLRVEDKAATYHVMNRGDRREVWGIRCPAAYGRGLSRTIPTRGGNTFNYNELKWPNRDPIEELGGLNLYGYVYNDPVDNYDPMGLAVLIINGTKYQVQSKNDFENAIFTPARNGNLIQSLDFEGHGVPDIGALVVNDADHGVSLNSQFQAPELYAFLKKNTNLFVNNPTIGLKACGSANPNVYSAADAFKKALPGATVSGYTGLLFQLGPIETGVPNNKLFADSIFSWLVNPGKGGVANVPYHSSYVNVK